MKWKIFFIYEMKMTIRVFSYHWYNIHVHIISSSSTLRYFVPAPRLLEIYKPKVLTEINFCLLIVFILFDRCTHYISGYYKWIVARYVWVCNRIAFTCLKSVAGKNIDLSYKAGLQINVTTCINFKCLQNCKKYLSNIVVSLFNLRLLVSLYDSIVNDE